MRLQPKDYFPERTPIETWVLTHLFRTWTALVTLIGFGLSFLYKPEWLTWWLRTTMAAIEKSPAHDCEGIAVQGVILIL
jgi:hypothetical protein